MGAAASLSAIQDFLLGRRPVTMAAIAIVAIDAVPVAIVAVSYSVIYQGAVLVLTELTHQLGLQS